MPRKWFGLAVCVQRDRYKVYIVSQSAYPNHFRRTYLLKPKNKAKQCACCMCGDASFICNLSFHKSILCSMIRLTQQYKKNKWQKITMIFLKDGIILVSFLASVSGRSHAQKQVISDMLVMLANRQWVDEFMPISWLVMLNLVLNNAPITPKYKKIIGLWPFNGSVIFSSFKQYNESGILNLVFFLKQYLFLFTIMLR